jgi:hypothetical protein
VPLTRQPQEIGPLFLPTADDSSQNSTVTVLVPPSLSLQILSRHIGWFWGLTSPIQAGSPPLHRLKLSKTGTPWRRERRSSAKSPQPAGRASVPCRNFRPHTAPTISLTSAAPGKPLALRLPVSLQATARVAPGRQKSGQRTFAPRSTWPTRPPPVAETCRSWLPLERLRRQTRQDLAPPGNAPLMNF